jgi:hypothetical protein
VDGLVALTVFRSVPCNRNIMIVHNDMFGSLMAKHRALHYLCDGGPVCLVLAGTKVVPLNL